MDLESVSQLIGVSETLTVSALLLGGLVAIWRLYINANRTNKDRIDELQDDKDNITGELLDEKDERIESLKTEVSQLKQDLRTAQDKILVEVKSQKGLAVSTNNSVNNGRMERMEDTLSEVKAHLKGDKNVV